MNEEENKVVEAVEETTQQVEEKAPVAEEQPDDGVIKVDLRNFKQEEQEDAIPEQEANASDVPVGESENQESSEAVVEEIRESSEEEQPVQNEEQPILEEITEEEVQEQTAELAEEIKEAVAEQKESGIELPENIQKVVDFINETGGSLEDYVRLNQDYSQLADNQLLFEYYKQSKPHLSNDEIEFLIEDNFQYDEDLDDERDIKRKN